MVTQSGIGGLGPLWYPDPDGLLLSSGSGPAPRFMGMGGGAGNGLDPFSPRRSVEGERVSAPAVGLGMVKTRYFEIRIAEHPNNPLPDDVVERLERAAAEVAGSTVEARETDRAWTASLI